MIIPAVIIKYLPLTIYIGYTLSSSIPGTGWWGVEKLGVAGHRTVIGWDSNLLQHTYIYFPRFLPWLTNTLIVTYPQQGYISKVYYLTSSTQQSYSATMEMHNLPPKSPTSNKWHDDWLNSAHRAPIPLLLMSIRLIIPQWMSNHWGPFRKFPLLLVKF